MKRPEKVRVKVRCLAFGNTKYLKDSVLSGAEITPNILRELASGSGTLEVVIATPVEKPNGLKANEEASPPDNTITVEVDVEKETNDTDTEMGSKKEVEEGTENNEGTSGTKDIKPEEVTKKVVKKAPTVAKKKTVKETKGNKKK